MILDWKCPKYLKPLLTEIQGMYWEDKKSTKANKDRTNKAIDCIVHAMVRAVAFNTDMVYVPLQEKVYSEPLIYNGVLVNRKVSYTATKRVLDWMEAMGLISLTKGYIVSWAYDGNCLIPKEKKPSTITISEYLKQKILPYAIKKNLFTNPSVVEIRDSKGNPIRKALDQYNIEMVKLYTKFNELAMKTDMSINGFSVDFQVKKIYNNGSFAQGGRVYGYNDPLIYSELLRRENRGAILLNKEKTVELDFKYLHIALLCEKDGIVLPEDFDPYQIELEGFSEKGARWVGKKACLIMINSGVGGKAKGGLIQDVRKDRRTKEYQASGDVPDLKGYKYVKVFNALLARNPYLTRYSKEPQGLYLQNTDSRIMDIVIAEINAIDEPVLPIHDSLVVCERIKDFTMTKMKLAYLAVMGSNDNCRIEVNYANENYRANAV